MQGSRVRTLAEIGLTVALSAVLGLIGVWQMPQGGSLSFTMLPIFVLALLRGPLVGVTAGMVYGLVDLMLEPYIFHPVQVLLDYPIAYGLCGLAGLFAMRVSQLAAEDRYASLSWQAIIPGIVLGALGRYAAHVLSGLVFFSTDGGTRTPLTASAPVPTASVEEPSEDRPSPGSLAPSIGTSLLKRPPTRPPVGTPSRAHEAPLA